jgi:hypothetical protein
LSLLLRAAFLLLGMAAASGAADQFLVLKDGRRFPVTFMERRGGRVVFETTRGERFSVPEDQVSEPPLASLPLAGRPAPAPPATPRPVGSPAPRADPASGPGFVPLPRRWAIDALDRARVGPKHAVGRGDGVSLALTGVVDALAELRRLPVGSGVSSANPDSLEFFGEGAQLFTSPVALATAELAPSAPAPRPRAWAARVTGAASMTMLRAGENNVVSVDVREGRARRRQDASLEEAYGEARLFDHLSVRAGIQPFVSDFRGLVFSDSNLGLRLFGSVHGHDLQYNLAFFDLLEKGTNSGLNTFETRDQQVFVANAFFRDFRPGYTLSLSLHRSRDEASKEQHYDDNGYLVRPAKAGVPRLHDVTSNYLGVAGEGTWGRWSVSHAAYLALGADQFNPIAARRLEILAGLGAVEVVHARGNARYRVSGLFASGDNDVADHRATGFDAIYELPSFAGGTFSFWARSGIVLAQTGVLLKAPASLLPALRSHKFEGQANFVNPGVLILNAGAELVLSPKLTVVVSGGHLWFHQTDALEELLFQPSIDHSIGFDLGGGAVYRPLGNDGLMVVGGLTGLIPTLGFNDIYTSGCDGVPGCGAKERGLANAFLQVQLVF